jgi:hypothetical protein
MNPEFWNIFPVSSRGFSGRIPAGIVQNPIGVLNEQKYTVTKFTKNTVNLVNFDYKINVKTRKQASRERFGSYF